jgi:hypothetical protein
LLLAGGFRIDAAVSRVGGDRAEVGVVVDGALGGDADADADADADTDTDAYARQPSGMVQRAS